MQVDWKHRTSLLQHRIRLKLTLVHPLEVTSSRLDGRKSVFRRRFHRKMKVGSECTILPEFFRQFRFTSKQETTWQTPTRLPATESTSSRSRQAFQTTQKSQWKSAKSPYMACKPIRSKIRGWRSNKTTKRCCRKHQTSLQKPSRGKRSETRLLQTPQHRRKTPPPLCRQKLTPRQITATGGKTTISKTWRTR